MQVENIENNEKRWQLERSFRRLGFSNQTDVEEVLLLLNHMYTQKEGGVAKNWTLNRGLFLRAWSFWGVFYKKFLIWNISDAMFFSFPLSFVNFLSFANNELSFCPYEIQKF